MAEQSAEEPNLRQLAWEVAGLRPGSARACTCADSVPLPEKEAEAKWRFACCYCWTSTTIFSTPELALSAWNSGKVRQHN